MRSAFSAVALLINNWSGESFIDGRWMFRELSAGINSVHCEADIEKVTPSQCPQYKDKFQKMS